MIQCKTVKKRKKKKGSIFVVCRSYLSTDSTLPSNWWRKEWSINLLIKKSWSWSGCFGRRGLVVWVLWCLCLVGGLVPFSSFLYCLIGSLCFRWPLTHKDLWCIDTEGTRHGYGTNTDFIHKKWSIGYHTTWYISSFEESGHHRKRWEKPKRLFHGTLNLRRALAILKICRFLHLVIQFCWGIWG